MPLPRERSEWCQIWWEKANDAELPRVLLIGDSICNGYHGVVKELLGPFANVDKLASSKNITDPALRKEVGYMLSEYKYAVIHFNHGLHGFGIPQESYETYLRAYVARMKQMAGDAKLAWGSITPLRGDHPRNQVIQARNEIAAKVMKENGIAIDDLYVVVAGRDEVRSGNQDDAYHYNGEGYGLLGQAVARYVAKLMDWELK